MNHTLVAAIGALSARLANVITADKIEASMIGARNKALTECNACNQPFLPDLKADSTPDGGEYQHFACPHCDADYPVATITRYGVEIRGALETARRLAAERNSAEWRHKAERLERQYARQVRKGERPGQWRS